MAWWDYAVGRPHDMADNAGGGELGVDLSTPQGTPVNSPFPGVVTYAGTSPSTGGIVKVWSQVPGMPQGVGEYFLHLNSVTVRQGQTITPSSLLGYTGGEQPGAGGWPHIEYGLFKDPKYSQGYWGFTTGSTIDPTPLVNYLHTTGGVVGEPSNVTNFASSVPGAQGIASGISGLLGGSSASGSASGSIVGGTPLSINITTPSSLQTALGAFGGTAQDLAWRVGLIVLGAVLVVVGFFVVIWPAQRSGAQAAAKFTAVAA